MQLQRFDVWDVEFEAENFEGFFRKKGIDYSGEEVKVAQRVVWKAVEHSLPEGVGSLELEQFCNLGTQFYINNFQDFLLPLESITLGKPPRVMVSDDQWREVCQGLVKHKVCCYLPLSEVCQVNNEPVLNGLFSVGKNEWVGDLESQRLIMNLVPLNRICKSLRSDVGTLPALPAMNSFLLEDGECLVLSSEDIRCFFYLFKVPSSWVRFLAFNRRVPNDLFPGHLQGQACVLASLVLPMGWLNSVSIAQHIHRNVVRNSLGRLPIPRGGEHEIRKDRPFPLGKNLFRVYLDNYDQLEVVDSELAAVLKGEPSAEVLALRQEYEAVGLPRHPKKAVSRELRAEVQGALVLGDVGVALPKPSKILQYILLCFELLRRGECKLRELQVVVGGFVYFCLFRRPLLCALNQVWRFMEVLKGYPPVVKLPLPDLVVEELVRFIALIPLAQLNFRTQVEDVVTCSDASQQGGGICCSTGLTAYGSRAALSPVRGDVPEIHDFEQVLTIGLFDGFGALRLACDRLNIPIAGHISIEKDPLGRRVVEANYPDSTVHDDVTTVDKEMVQGWALKYSNVALVLIGAGPPCQGVSGLNADRRGALRDHRSCLFKEVPRIEDLVRHCFPWAQVHLLMESVASMSEGDRAVMSEAVNLACWSIDSLGLTLCRRSRLYWVTWDLLGGEDIEVHLPEPGKVGQILFGGHADPNHLLEAGWELAGPALPTFTTARPSPVPGRRPAGLDKCSLAERHRWEEDAHRFPPYQYCHANGLVNKQGAWRTPSVNEREVLMGFPRDYTAHCRPKSYRAGKDFENERLTLIGNSWQVGVIVYLVSCLLYPLGLCEKLGAEQIRQLLRPGCGRNLQTVLLNPPLRQLGKAPAIEGSRHLVKRMLGVISIKGEDLLLQAANETQVRYHRLRASVPSRLWRWREIAAWQWEGSPEHINSLELRAILTAVKWWVSKRKSTNAKFLHLTDSLVCLHALTRGRTSSRRLRRTLMRINSFLLGADLHPVWGYVHTSQNPADRPSRRARYVKKKWLKAKDI